MMRKISEREKCECTIKVAPNKMRPLDVNKWVYRVANSRQFVVVGSSPADPYRAGLPAIARKQ